MLLEFSVTNFRSIGEKQTLSLIPASNHKEFSENVYSAGRHTALNAIAFYGANAGGKSNFLKAMNVMYEIVHKSALTSSTTFLPFDPFLLREGFNKIPTSFEVLFTIDAKRYRYGFSYNESSIVEEWLYRKNIGREVCLFLRAGDLIDVKSGYNIDKNIIDMVVNSTRSNALFISFCDMFNVEEAKSIVSWFDSMYMINGLNTEDHKRTTIDLLRNNYFHDKINMFFKNIGIDINEITIETTDLHSDTSDDRHAKKLIQILASHRYYDEDGKPTEKNVNWDFKKRESAGTNKAFDLCGPILWALSTGGILIIDEIEAKLHPILTLNTIDIFLSPKSNPKQAQIIFATHDTNLLSYAKLRRDQIYFAEKNKWESTEIFSLSDFVYFKEKDGQIISEKERSDSDKERRYIEGRYGAIPALGNFKSFIRGITWQDKVD